jgi:lipid-A-disaccharide synthase
VSLVNLIAHREVVKELVANTFSVDNIRTELEALLPGGNKRETMLDDYEEIHRLLGESDAPEKAASLIINFLNK